MTRTEDNDTFSRPRTDLPGSPCRIRQYNAAVRQSYDETAGLGLKYFTRRYERQIILTKNWRSCIGHSGHAASPSIFLYERKPLYG